MYITGLLEQWIENDRYADRVNPYWLFIAFNFTIANDLPRLGYITLMDTFMMATFGITGLVVLANVRMKRLQRHGRDEFINKLDEVGVWLYPLVYAGGGGADVCVVLQLELSSANP